MQYLGKLDEREMAGVDEALLVSLELSKFS